MITGENIIQHITLEGQRWDQIALIRYGDASKMNDIIEANPELPIYDRFPAGVIVNVPIIEKTEVLTDAEKLPPWKR